MPGSCGLPCPNLIRNVTIENKSGEEVQVTSVHGSGETVKTTIAAGENKLIEREINHGTWTSFDNITDFVVRRTSHPDDAILTLKGTEASGIDCRIYEIKPNFTAQRVLVHQ